MLNIGQADNRSTPNTEDNKTMLECPSPIFIRYQEEWGEKIEGI